MPVDKRELLQFLRFELQFLEDGGYGRSPRAPWRARVVFEDSPSCLNFADASRSHPCRECWLMPFVPAGHQQERSPCHFIPLTEKGETIDYFNRWGSQSDLEEALAAWLRRQITQLDALPDAGEGEGAKPAVDAEISRLAGT